jgi:hypothetical protein
MTINIHKDVVQGSDEWFALRCGVLTASEMDKCITPTLKIADNDDTRSHVFELLAQRINKYVEPSYVSDDMMRGHEEEVLARIAYSEKYAPVEDVGFVTNDKFGFILGCSPDGFVGDDGLIECKSRKQKYQLETILSKGMPSNKKINCMLQIQTALLVTERKWCDFISYHGGMPMVTYRILPDFEMQEAIVRAATAFEEKIKEKLAEYNAIMADSSMRLIPTERVIEEEMV